MSDRRGPVLLDCRIARRRETGGARYARELGRRLQADGREPRVRMLMGPPPLPRRNALTSLGNLLLDLAWTHVALPLLAVRHRASAIHSTFNWAPLVSPCPRIVTVQDLTFERMPEEYDPGFRRFASIFTRLSARRATRVITISEATADDLVELYGVPRDRIDVVYIGVDGVGGGRIDAGRRQKAILHVGEFEPRKRVIELVEGFGIFAATPEGRGWRLLLAGRGGADQDEVARLAAATPGVEPLGFVSDERLRELYATSSLLVSASRAEGFCLPIAEALVRGCPVLVTQSPALVEAGGPGARVMPEPVTPASIAAALADAVGDRADLEARGRTGMVHADAFTWENCVEGTRAVYDRVTAPGEDRAT